MAASSTKSSWLNSVAGHFWTALPAVLDAVRPARLEGSIRLQTRLTDPTVGEIAIRAEYNCVPSADSLVAIVHGIIGNADSGNCVAAARAAVQAGCSAVRISLRGADGNGDDIYHAGLTDDLKALLSMDGLRRYRRVFLVGYSQGGLNVLHAAAHRVDPRISSVVSICPPLDLKAAMENFDRPQLRPYKVFMNARANDLYDAVRRRNRVHSDMRPLRRARTCAAWNELTIVPRFGFQSAEDYYKCAALSRHWSRLHVPALIAASRFDPIVPYRSLRRELSKAPANVQVKWLDGGGHINFPPDTSLGESAPPGLEPQFIAWLLRHAGRCRRTTAPKLNHEEEIAA